jgi:hypothetical protein
MRAITAANSCDRFAQASSEQHLTLPSGVMQTELIISRLQRRDAASELTAFPATGQ